MYHTRTNLNYPPLGLPCSLITDTLLITVYVHTVYMHNQGFPKTTSNQTLFMFLFGDDTLTKYFSLPVFIS